MHRFRFVGFFPILCALFGSAAFAADPDPVLLQGQVEAVDTKTSKLVIAGQTIAATGDVLRRVRKGDQVSVAGKVGGTNSRITKALTGYVPGSSRVMVSGIVAECKPSVAKIRIGTVWIDYSAALSASPNLKPQKGDLVVSAGIQPLSGGTLISNSTDVAQKGSALTQFIGISAVYQESVRLGEPLIGVVLDSFGVGGSHMGGIIGGGTPGAPAGPLRRSGDPTEPTE